MNKLCSPLFTLTVLLTFASSAQPQTPAPVPANDLSAPLASARPTAVAGLNKANERVANATFAVTTATKNKSDAEAELSRLRSELKGIVAQQSALQKAMAEKLPEELQKLKAATDDWMTARANFAAAASDVVRKVLKPQLEKAEVGLASVKTAFATFVRKVNGDAGTGITENLDPLVVNDVFAAAKANLDEAVATAGGKVAAAEGKAHSATQALTRAVTERDAAKAALLTPVAAAGPYRAEQLATQPVVLPETVSRQISDTANAAGEIGSLKQQVTDLQRQIGGDQGLIKRVETLQTAVSGLRIPTAKEIAKEIKIPTAAEIAAEIKLPATLKLDAEQLKRVQDSLVALQAAMTDLQGRPAPADTSAATVRIEAALTALQTKLGTTVYEEAAGTDQCGQRWVRYYIVKDGEKYYLFNYRGNK